MTIIHGENTSLSRKKLQELIDQAKNAQVGITRLEASKLTLAQLNDALGSSDLFGGEQLFIIEELHSLLTSTRKKELIERVASFSGSNIILYEKKLLTATMLKKFPQAEVFEFKVTNAMWEFLDSLGNFDKKKLLIQMHKAIEQNEAFLVFTMMIRQIRQLIQVKSGGQVAGAPFMIAKLKKQANLFTLDQLLALHAQLFKLEVGQKTSTLNLDLASELDLLLFRM